MREAGQAVLQRGDMAPHVEVRTAGGELFSYAAIWQRRNLVLVTLPAAPSIAGDDYARGLAAMSDAFRARIAECVVTRDDVAGLPAPGVLVADRWGEIVYVTVGSDVRDLPTPQALLEWLDHLETRCPECEGEAR